MPVLAIVGLILAACGSTTSSPATTSAPPAKTSANTPAQVGVTSKVIRLGVPYVNFTALRSLGVNINEGSFPDAYNAIAASMNAHGGVDGRKLAMYYVEMNPAVAAQATQSCSQLTENDKIFAAITPVFPDCYQQTHNTPVLGGSLPGTLPAGAAPDFTLTPPGTAFDPLQLAAFAKRGAFKGKKVGIFYSSTSDHPEVLAVQAALKKLHVDVVATAEDSAVATDAVASDQQVQTIALRFQSAGVNEVVAVGGSGSTTWPRALKDNQSTYRPPWIATDESALLSYVTSTKGGNPYLGNVLAATPTPTTYQIWKDPAVQKCAAIVRKAYPSDTIVAPANPSSPGSSSASQTSASVEQACQYLALFAKIADAAGKNLTVSTFAKAGYGLRNFTVPGSGGPVSFGPSQDYTLGPVDVVVYSQTAQNLVPASATAK